MRTLCPVCKVNDDDIPDPVWAALTDKWNLPKPQKACRPLGCPECRQTGYRGRTGLYELLTVSQTFATLVRPETSLSTLQEQSITDGMTPLRIAGALKITEGITSCAEVLKVTSTLL